MMITAIVLAAGLSTRMGRPKMILPWGDTTVIGQVVNTLLEVGLVDIVCVTGGARRQVEVALHGLPVTLVYNPRFSQDSMIVSLQAGLGVLDSSVDAAIVVLGDQPQIQSQVVRDLISKYESTSAPLVVPSCRMRRGHPWIIKQTLWDSVMTMAPSQTMRDLLEAYAAHICYLTVESDTIFRDIDTPDDYLREVGRL